MIAEVVSPTRVSPFMSVAECGAYLRPGKPINVQTLYRWAKCGKIPARRLNGVLVFHQGDIDSWTASKAASPQPPSRSPFELARMRVRSLKTEHTVKRHPRIQKGRVDGN